ncbi:class I SAM-dependent methyltransferase [Myroides marinus]|uniref:Methyltransferase domain-containing protein n=1 Tax=Myroides marinus TaxID=703342 RepID=A0A1H6X944_9FLAO|nr:class I SAM-dependent methyltransferase [Myroides marinus]MDM1390180.1 class I SAM-dependent methyltransferase [Myroides marinus]MDM1502924.1 class I SAM-dependent methyltransferase [Myroides marinus]MDM1531672.1 class I SAM-dependent methyltransferase [Myroides marinus]MDM1538601.1 class I SAM-dependent methyltransferase [Myroides marinus]SEJ21440.1 Methyltransferase domain-containing protein [Myroides marinus]
MDAKKDYIEVNKKTWNEKVALHVDSEFYNMKDFLAGETSLNEIELNLLGDIKGKKILHLQCHFGQDTLSLARMGAEVTGVDLSDKAVEKGRELAEQLGLNARFICSDVYKLPEVLEEQFDIVYTSYGVIGWLPDMNKWAEVVSKFVKPGGKFVFVEFHPFVWMYDYDFTKVDYSYFNVEDIVETESGTYADRSADVQLKSVSWNHSIAEVVQSLVDHQLQIKTFEEHNYSPYSCFNHVVEIAPKKFQIAPFGDKVPLVYAIVASK